MVIIESISQGGIFLRIRNPALLSVVSFTFWVDQDSDWYMIPSIILATNVIVAIALTRKLFIGNASYYYKAQLFYDELCGRSDMRTARIFYRHGIIMKSRGAYIEAIRDLNEAIHISKQTSIINESMYDPFFIVECSTQVAASLGALGEFRKSKNMFKSIISDIERRHGKKNALIGQILNDMAIMLKNSGQLNEALTYYQRALDIFEYHGDEKQVAVINSNLSLVYSRLQEFDIALDFNQRAIDIKMNSDEFDDQSIAVTMNNKGLILQNMGLLDEALKCHLSAAKTNRNSSMVNRRLSLAQSYFNIASVHAQKFEYAQATNYSRMSKNIRTKILGNQHHLSISSEEQLENLAKKLQSSGKNGHTKRGVAQKSKIVSCLT